MRQRPNFLWIQDIYKVQKNCTECNNPFFKWDKYIIELYEKITLCENCMDSEKYPEEWCWEKWIYSKIKSVISVSNKDLFLDFMWDKKSK